MLAGTEIEYLAHHLAYTCSACICWCALLSPLTLMCWQGGDVRVLCRYLYPFWLSNSFLTKAWPPRSLLHLAPSLTSPLVCTYTESILHKYYCCFQSLYRAGAHPPWVLSCTHLPPFTTPSPPVWQNWNFEGGGEHSIQHRLVIFQFCLAD